MCTFQLKATGAAVWCEFEPMLQTFCTGAPFFVRALHTRIGASAGPIMTAMDNRTIGFEIWKAGLEAAFYSVGMVELVWVRQCAHPFSGT